MKEKLRHKLLAFLHSKKASEENPFNCHILLDSETMDTPTITEMFEDNKGIMPLIDEILNKETPVDSIEIKKDDKLSISN